MKLQSRFWLERGGVKVFGTGPFMLLKAVDRLGTLSQAAADLEISYSKAWSIINRAEKELNFPLLESQIGGVDGGGSSLTPEARKLMQNYQAFIQEADILLKKLYIKHFENI